MIAHAPDDLAALLAYIAELESIARPVAIGVPFAYLDTEWGEYRCSSCDHSIENTDDLTPAEASKRIQHAADCLVSRARALGIPPAS